MTNSKTISSRLKIERETTFKKISFYNVVIDNNPAVNCRNNLTPYRLESFNDYIFRAMVSKGVECAAAPTDFRRTDFASTDFEKE